MGLKVKIHDSLTAEWLTPKQIAERVGPPHSQNSVRTVLLRMTKRSFRHERVEQQLFITRGGKIIGKYRRRPGR